MTPKQLLTVAVLPGLSLLPDRMDSPEARRMLVAMASQESGLKHRHPIGGPAHGLWRLDMRAAAVVLNDGVSSQHARRACDMLLYDADDLARVYTGLGHNDALAAVFARLLLWSLPQALPATLEEGWEQYTVMQQPRRPDKQRWPMAWAAGEVSLV